MRPKYRGVVNVTKVIDVVCKSGGLGNVEVHNDIYKTYRGRPSLIF